MDLIFYSLFLIALRSNCRIVLYTFYPSLFNDLCLVCESVETFYIFVDFPFSEERDFKKDIFMIHYYA